MDHPHNVLVCQTCGDYALSAKIRQSHTSHIKAEAIKDQATFLLAEELHHIATGVNKDEDIPTTQATTHGVGDDAAQSVEALAHINGLVIQPVPVCPIKVEHYPAVMISCRCAAVMPLWMRIIVPAAVRISTVRKLSELSNGPVLTFVFPEVLAGGIIGETNSPPGRNWTKAPGSEDRSSS